MAIPRRAALRDWLDDVADATARAARRALERPSPEREVQKGASGSPTSALDKAAEKVVIEALDDAPIPLNLCSEEVGNLDRGADWWLLLDPVDGTRNALRGIPFSAVCLAVGRKDLAGVELGVVRSIEGKDRYWGERGRGATLNGTRIRARRLRKDELIVGAALDYQDQDRLPVHDHVHFRDLGSAALEMCYVAEGKLDAFYSPTPLVRIIDIAASTVIVNEAGGRVLDLDGRPLNVPFDASKKFAMIAVAAGRSLEVFR